MTALQPCSRCRRHVRGVVCPFCGSDVAGRDAVSTVGRMSRAMVFASATLALGACGGAHKQQKAPDDMGEERHHGGGGCMDPDPQKIDELEAQKAELEKKQPQDADTKAQEADVEEQLRRARQPVCAPYGAPPARCRVV